MLLPLAGLRSPVNKSLRLVGKITISMSACFALSRPATNQTSDQGYCNKCFTGLQRTQQHTNVIPFNSRASIHNCCINHFNKLVIIASTSLLNRSGSSTSYLLMSRCLATSVEGRTILQRRSLDAIWRCSCSPTNRIACSNLQ